MTMTDQILTGAWADVTTIAGAIFYAFLFVLGAGLLARSIRGTANGLIRRDSHAHLDPTMVAFLADLAQIAVYIVAVVLYAHLIPALRTLGTALLTGVSVISIILGIAAQGTFGNLVAGIALLLYRPFRVGDHVRVFVPLGMEHGVVERITLGYTFIIADDQHRIVVPNSFLSTQIIVNLTASQPPPSIAQVHVRVNPEDSAPARELLLTLAREHPRALEPIACHVLRLDRAGAMIQLTAACSDHLDVRQVVNDLYVDIPKRFMEAGVVLITPQIPLRQSGSA